MSSFFSQINDGGLIACSDLAKYNIEEGYSAVPVIHKSWKTSEHRLLVVIESVDSLDIKSGNLLSGRTEDLGSRGGKSNHNPMRSVFSNILDKSVSMLRPYGIDVADKFAFGIVNFNAKRIRNLDRKDQMSHFAGFTNRVLKVIDKLKPTHVLVAGDTATYYLLQALEAPEGTPKRLQPDKACADAEFKRGWVFNRIYKGHEFLLTPTLDIESLYNGFTIESDDDDDDDGEMVDSSAAADLLFFVARNVCNMFAGKMLHSIEHVVPNPVYIDTIERFDKLMDKLLEADLIAVDTETANLSSYHNKIFSAQFAIDVNKGYVIPINHPKTPFSKQETKYILKRCRQLLNHKSGKTFVTVNGSFDIRIFRTQAGMPVLHTGRLHEVTAGEQNLDENIGLFGRLKFYFKGAYIGTSYQNLRAMCALYGNDWYYRAKFSKEHRMLIGTMDPDDPDALLYCLPAGEQVLTTTGRKNIEELVVGDKVMSFNHERQQEEFKPIVNVFKHKPKKRLLRLCWNGGEVVVTEDHPVWSEDRQVYVPAGELKPGERLRMLD